MASSECEARDAAWQYEPLVVHIRGRFQSSPSIRLRLSPVFFNPHMSTRKWLQERKEIEQRFSTSSKAVDQRWRVDSVDHYLQPKRKRVVSAYMDSHKISSLLRTFEIMSLHREECGTPVTISWQSRASGGPGGYVGIVSGRGDVEVSQKFPIGMVKIVVDQMQNVAMLRSRTLDYYLTGHMDSGTVDGKADSSDVTACHWRVVPCEKVFNDLSDLEKRGVVLQYCSKRHSRDRLQNGLFFIITRKREFRLESFSFVRDYGVFTLNW